MAGIYIHIPFCRQACRYCDFFFTVSLQYRNEYIKALLKEISLHRSAWSDIQFNSLYFGGGTPSILDISQLAEIYHSIQNAFQLSENAEVCLEANPDDLNDSILEQLKTIGFNRLSIGIQSFRHEDLELLRRSHSSEQAKDCVYAAENAGFNNMTIDLIYGIPGLDPEDWQKNLETALSMPIQHISAYHLSYEPGTVLFHWKEKGRIKSSSEETSIQQYDLLRKMAEKNGFEHYEISNFARRGFRSRHNTGYWTGEPYLGLGPSAHSFDGERRSWNISSLKNYIKAVNQGSGFYEQETPGIKDQYHDYLLTSLRRKEGLSKSYLINRFGVKILKQIESKLSGHIKNGSVLIKGDSIHLSPEGWFISDAIIGQLMVENENLFIGKNC